MPRPRLFPSLALCAAFLFSSGLSAAALTSPKQHFGFAIGDDYHLATYTQTEAYFKLLASQSPRLRLVDIGRTEEGRTQWMVVCSSPANLARLDRLKEISRTLARAEDADEARARALAAEGRAVVWIDGGLHATETVGTHQLIETLWQLASREDAETVRILDEVVVLLVHANPDGQELMSSWYMRRPEPAKRVIDQLPKLYQKYAGHDNNRDFFMSALRESANMNRQLYVDWIPQVMYNHHQSGPAGSVVAGPPYRDPFNHVYDPLVMTTLDAVGAAMSSRLNREGKPGYTQRNGSVFSTWFNGGLRTTTYFHNMVGILSEIIGSPTPSEVPLVPARLVPNGATPFPVTPRPWRYADSIEYSLSLNYAVLDFAARHRDSLLLGIWRMGRNSIERGSRDHWTHYPRRVAAIQEAHARDNPPAKGAAAAGDDDDSGGSGSAAARRRIPSRYFDAVMRKPELRDPRGYILPADQADFPTAVKFVNALIKTGIVVHRATTDFTVAGKAYPAGSYVVKTDQAFRPHVIDMFEPQDHPNDFLYEGGPPIAPYDSAGWTLAFEMGVKFDRVLDAFEGPLARLPWGELQAPPPGRLAPSAGGWRVGRAANDGFTLVNRLMRAGVEVSVSAQGSDFLIPASARAVLEPLVAELGVTPVPLPTAPAGARRLSPARIALWDRYGGSMPSGWTRLLFEQFGFAFDVIYPPQIDAGGLREKYDVIVFPSGAIPRSGSAEGSSGGYSTVREPSQAEMPAEYRGRSGRFTAAKSLPPLKAFLEAGGVIVTVGTSANLAYHLGLPVRNALVQPGAKGGDQPLPKDKYFVPGSILRVSLDTNAPVAAGMPAEADVYFDSSHVFRLADDATARGVRPLAWFPHAAPLRSGWAWGQHHLKDGVTAFEAPVGQGRVYVFGPEITFRAQTHGTFKLLFNALYRTVP